MDGRSFDSIRIGTWYSRTGIDTWNNRYPFDDQDIATTCVQLVMVPVTIVLMSWFLRRCIHRICEVAETSTFRSRNRSSNQASLMLFSLTI
jgi:hypothetical protein